MKVHVPSAFAALGVVALGLFLSSQSGPLIASAFRIKYMPHPRDYVQIREGTPYTVPAGKLFVLTALGTVNNTGTPYAAILRVDGVEQCTARTDVPEPSVGRMPPGFTVTAGHTIEATQGSAGRDDARAWGYLANE